MCDLLIKEVDIMSDEVIKDIEFVKCCFTCGNCNIVIDTEFIDYHRSTSNFFTSDINNCECRLLNKKVDPFKNVCDKFI